MLRVPVSLLVLAALTSSASAFDLLVTNDSDYAFHKLYVAPAKSKNWSDEKLQQHFVEPKGRFTVRNLAAGSYDLKVIDEDDDACVIANINIDRDKEQTFTSDSFMSCHLQTSDD